MRGAAAAPPESAVAPPAGSARGLLAPRRRGLAVAAAALAAGALVGTSLPPISLWPAGFLGSAAAYLLVRRLRTGGRTAAGGLFGLGQFAIGLYFLKDFSAVGYALVVLVEAGFVAAGFALAGSGRPLAFAGALTLTEWARDSWPFGGLPPGASFLGQAEGPLLVLARLGGPLLLVFVLSATSSGLVEGGLALIGRGGAGRRGPLPGLLAGPGLAAVLLTGAALAQNGGPAVGTVTAAAVQGGGARGYSESEIPPTVAFSATMAAAGAIPDGVRLVALPEDAVPLPEGGSPALLGAVAHLARARHATVLAGVTEPVGATRFLNEVLVFSPAGQVVARYEKAHPVPFGEYVPLRGLLSHLVDLSAVPRDAVVGRGSGEVATPVGRLGLLVSYETFFAGRGRAAVGAGGEALLVLTNTASYATSQAPAEELAASRLQAVAGGRVVLQAATTGYSAVISPTGAVEERSGLGERRVLTVRLVLRRGETPYARLGDGPLLAASGILVALGLGRGASLSGRRPRRLGRATAPPT